MIRKKDWYRRLVEFSWLGTGGARKVYVYEFKVKLVALSHHTYHMDETEAGLQRLLYLRNTAIILHILRKILVTTL